MTPFAVCQSNNQANMLGLQDGDVLCFWPSVSPMEKAASSQLGRKALPGIALMILRDGNPVLRTSSCRGVETVYKTEIGFEFVTNLVEAIEFVTGLRAEFISDEESRRYRLVLK